MSKNQFTVSHNALLPANRIVRADEVVTFNLGRGFVTGIAAEYDIARGVVRYDRALRPGDCVRFLESPDASIAKDSVLTFLRETDRFLILRRETRTGHFDVTVSKIALYADSPKDKNARLLFLRPAEERGAQPETQPETDSAAA